MKSDMILLAARVTALEKILEKTGVLERITDKMYGETTVTFTEGVSAKRTNERLWALMKVLGYTERYVSSQPSKYEMVKGKTK